VILKCRLELQKLLGHMVSDANLRRVASLAQILFRLQPSDHGPPLVSERHVNGTGDDIEFGADLVFQAPSRFLVDISLEDGELLGEERTVPSSLFHEGWYEHNDSPHCPSAANEGNYNLSWLRDACDRIVGGSTSLLSREELAMAICRVLDSGKPSEEVSIRILILA
jgi:activating signal cointegrator complex subunit 3